MEKWRDIKGYENAYRVSSLGNVKSLPRPVRNNTGIRITSSKILKPKDTFGYNRAALYKDRSCKFFLIHRLVAEAFIPNPEDKPWVNHKNGIKDDNRVENLEWCTISENVQHGFDELGRKNPRRLLNETDIPKIKQLYSEGYLQREIGEMFGIKRNTISRILRGISYGLEKQ